MKRLVVMIASVCVLMVIIAGSGAFLLSNIFIAQSKVDAVGGVAKGVSLTLSEQINLLNSMLDKMAQDPEIVDAAAQNNPELLAAALKNVETHFPGAVSVKFLLPQSDDPNVQVAPAMGFADTDMAKKTFEKDQLSTIQGEAASDRHLAIARRIMINGVPKAVVLVGLNYDFVNRIMAATHLEKGYIELRQGKLVLASVGNKKDENDVLDGSPVQVPNTDWQLFYESREGTSMGELALMVSIILIPAMAVALGFVTGYRKFSDLVAEETSWLTKAFKDILTERPLGEYPVRLGETRSLITTMAQFKRVVNDKSFSV
jgi:phosphomannomutase/phosphoglucomutase